MDGSYSTWTLRCYVSASRPRSAISHHFVFLTCRIQGWTECQRTCGVNTLLKHRHTYFHALTLLSCIKALFIREKSFNVTGLFRDHVFAQLGRVKQVFNSCDENLYFVICSSHVLKQNMFWNMSRKMALFPSWALHNKIISTLKLKIWLHK